MPQPEGHPGSPADWLRRAKSDLALARISPSEGILLEDLCFHTQQAAEKALKAVLVARSIAVEKTHSLPRLFEILPADVAVPDSVRKAVILTDYAVTSRYPGDYESIEAWELQEAIELADGAVAWAEALVGER